MALIDIALVGLAALSASEDTTQSHRAHVHGVGQLTIAMDETGRIEAELDAPGDTVFGFEGEPSSSAQHEAAERARAILLDGTRIVEFSSAASCTFEHADLAEDAHDEDGQDEDSERHEDGEHDHDNDDHAARHAHSDIRVTYHFACSRPGRLQTVGTGLFDLFERFQKIDTVWLSRQGQEGFELTPASTTHRLQR